MFSKMGATVGPSFASAMVSEPSRFVGSSRREGKAGTLRVQAEKQLTKNHLGG